MGRWGGVGKGTFWYLVEFWERQKKVGWAQDYQGKDSFGLNSWAGRCGLFPSSCCEHAPSSWLGLPNCSVWKRWEIKKTHALGWQEGGQERENKAEDKSWSLPLALCEDRMGHLCSSQSYFMSSLGLCFFSQKWKRDPGSQRWRRYIWEESIQAYCIPLANKSGKREAFLSRALYKWVWIAALSRNNPVKSLTHYRHTPGSTWMSREAKQRLLVACSGGGF